MPARTPIRAWPGQNPKRSVGSCDPSCRQAETISSGLRVAPRQPASLIRDNLRNIALRGHAKEKSVRNRAPRWHGLARSGLFHGACAASSRRDCFRIEAADLWLRNDIRAFAYAFRYVARASFPDSGWCGVQGGGLHDHFRSAAPIRVPSTDANQSVMRMVIASFPAANQREGNLGRRQQPSRDNRSPAPITAWQGKEHARRRLLRGDTGRSSRAAAAQARLGACPTGACGWMTGRGR